MDCPGSRPLTRRQFLAFAGLTVAGLGALPHWIRRAGAALDSRRKKILIVLFQRGAADGLNIVPPFLDPIYVRSRPSIRIQDPTRGTEGAIDLDGRFGLHPRLAPLMPLWKTGRFAIVQAAGSHDPTRSHFDAQDFMESGTPGIKSTETGWLNRTLSAGKFRRDPLAAVSITPRLPRSMRGPFPVQSAQSADELKGGPAADTFESLYEEAADTLLAGAAKELAEASQLARKLPKFDPTELERAGYPKGRIGRDFFELARLILSDVGLRIGFLEAGGWDHHFNEGSSEGQLARRLDEVGTSIAAFFRQLGDRSEDVLLVTMTEFGRTIEENGNGGTDHGHAGVMMLFGGALRGGKVYGRWPGLEPERRFEGRDLEVTTDFRQVLGEVVDKHLGLRQLTAVFPGGPFAPLGLLR